MDQVVAADLQSVAVAGDDPHREVGPHRLQPRGHGRGPAVDRVDAVGVHVIREAAGAADPGDEDQLFPRNAQRGEGLLHLRPGWRSRRSPDTSGRPDRWRNRPARVAWAGTCRAVRLGHPFIIHGIASDSSFPDHPFRRVGDHFGYAQTAGRWSCSGRSRRPGIRPGPDAGTGRGSTRASARWS